MPNEQYNEKDIIVLEGLDPVRKRPGMYIGSTDSKGLHHLVWEIVSNAVDEAIAGYGNHIIVTIHDDNSIEVTDFGRGIPFKMHSSGRPTTEVIFTTLHSGGKFDGKAYKAAGGLHGVGGAVVNALSTYLELTIFRDGKMVTQRFENGGRIVGKINILSDSRKTGTSVRFKPDKAIFRDTTIFDYNVIATHLRESAFLLKGVKFSIIDKRGRKNEETFYYADGIKDFVKYLVSDQECIMEPHYAEYTYVVTKDTLIETQIAFTYTNGLEEQIFSYVNNVKTIDGGTHVTSFKSVFTKVINEYARKYGILRDKDENLSGGDLRSGLFCVISLYVPESILQFEGQTKSKLGTSEAKNAVDALVTERLTTFLGENKEISMKIIDNAIKLSKAREKARLELQNSRLPANIKNEKVNLSGKLTPAGKANKDINELFLVEGDSAGGSAKQGRNSLNQAILPLRGKVINSEKAELQTIYKNEEIFTIIHTIGAGFGPSFDIKKCNYKKIIIMTDADDDGLHIQILLLTFFFRYMKPLIENGYLYIAQPPLYKLSRKAQNKEEIVYALSDDELNSLLEKKSNYIIQRYKGLGEMNAKQLWDTTMDPKTRNLIQVTMEDFGDSDRITKMLMGDDPNPRKNWIEANVDFGIDDEFEVLSNE